MGVRRLWFFGDYAAESPVWSDLGMVSLEDLPVSDAARAEAHRWVQRWDELATADMAAGAYANKMSSVPSEPVRPEQWASLERDGRAVCKRLQKELGEEWHLEWAG